MAQAREEEAARLFGTDEVPSVPGETSTHQPDHTRNDSPPTDFVANAYYENTLDESVLKTVRRDLVRIALNLKLVLLPFLRESQKSRSLRNWDLWGPLLFILLLGIILSSKNNDSSTTVFTMTFIVVGLGALILTLNIALLGGTIVFFQSLCLLGYCLFPLVVAAFVVSLEEVPLMTWAFTILGVGWASCAAFPFIREATPERKRGMAMYPVFLLYLCVGWMIVVM